MKSRVFTITTYSLDDFKLTLASLSKTNNKLQESHLPSELITVNIQNNKLYESDSFLWLSEALSKGIFLSEIINLTSAPPMLVDQITSSLDYLFGNKNFPKLEAVADYQKNV